MSLGDALRWGLTPNGYREWLDRHHRIAAWAGENGLTYNWEDPYNLAALPFAFFRQTRVAKGTFGAVAGSWKGTEIYLADHHCRYRSVDEWDDPFARTIVVVPIPGMVPAFVAQNHVGWRESFPRSWGFQRVKTGDPVFDKEFRVHSTQPDYASWVLHPPSMREWLLSRPRGFTCELHQMNMLLSQELVPVEHLPTLLDFAVGLVPQIHPPVWEWYPRPQPG
jgi:hypothetical protein